MAEKELGQGTGSIARAAELTRTFTLNLSHSHRDPSPRRHSGSAYSMQQGRRRKDTISVERGWEAAEGSLPRKASATTGAWGQELPLWCAAKHRPTSSWGLGPKPTRPDHTMEGHRSQASPLPHLWAPAFPRCQSFPSLCVGKN